MPPRVTATDGARRRILSAFAIVALSTFLLSTLWALASPVFSVPDENAHATKAIAQVHGQVVGEEVEGIKHLVVDLPDGFDYRPELTCFAFEPTVTADCAPELGGGGGTPWFNTWVGTYNPTYYAVIGWPALLLDGNEAIIAMRIASALVNALLFGAGAAAAFASARRSWLPVGSLVVLSPMIMYFSGSVNPQGFEVAGAFLLWWAGLRLAEHWRDGTTHGLSAGILWPAVTVGALVVSNARATGPLWTLIVLALVATVVGWRTAWHGIARVRTIPWLVALALPAAFSAFWTLGVGSLSNQADVGDAPLVGRSPLVGAWAMIRQTPAFIQQAAGYFGWLDTPMPGSFYLLLALALAIPVMTALAVLRRRSAARLLVVVSASLVVPIVLQAYSVSQTGIIWQGRYGLFLYIGVVIVSVWMLEDREAVRVAPPGRRLVPIAVGSLSAFGLMAYVVALRRYTVGADVPITEMLDEIAWSPPIPWQVLVLVYGLVSAGAAVWAIRVALQEDDDVPSAAAPRSLSSAA